MDLRVLLFDAGRAREFLTVVHGCAVYEPGNSLEGSGSGSAATNGNRRTFRTLPFSCRMHGLEATKDDWLLRTAIDGSAFDVWWAVLGVLFSSRDACDRVMRETPDAISGLYFHNFYGRLSNLIFGTNSTGRLPAAVVVGYEQAHLESLCRQVGV
jgi:hypothetical protein